MGLELAQAFIRVRADGSGLDQDFRGIQTSTSGYLNNLLSSVQGRVMAAVATVGAGLTTMGAVYKAGLFEQTVIAFETMIGSAEETKKTLEDLTEFAAKTPFEMPEIESAARGLIQFGERGDELMETLNMLGNAASGTSTPFGFLANVFNQVRGVGKLLTQDFRQLSTRGILSLQDIAKHYGVTTEAAQKMLSEGKISFEDLKSIFKELSGEGGRFHNLMEKQSKSLLGLWSTFKDALGITARTLGEQLLPTAKQFVTSAIEMVEVVREWVTVNKDQIKGYIDTATSIGKYILAATAAAAAIKLVGMAITFFTSVTKGAITATAILKALSGPSGWVQLAAGIGVAVATVHQLNKMLPEVSGNEEKAAEGAKKMSEALDAVAESADSAADSLGKVKWGDSEGTAGIYGVVFDQMDKTMEAASERAEHARDVLDQTIHKLNEEAQTMGPETLAREVGWLRHWTLEAQAATAELEALEAIVSKFGSGKEAQGFLESAKKAGRTPMEDLDEYKSKLEAFKAIGLLSEKEFIQAMKEAEEKSPMHKAVEETKELSEELDSLSDKMQGETDDWIAAGKALRAFEQIPGVTKEQIEGFKKLQKEVIETKAALATVEKYKTPTEKAKEELSDLWDLYSKKRISKETYQRGLETYQKQMQPQNLIGAGRIGFEDYGKQIQDAIIQRNDPAKTTAEENKRQTGLLTIIKDELKKIGAKPVAGALT